jgi:hypothetical protein
MEDSDTINTFAAKVDEMAGNTVMTGSAHLLYCTASLLPIYKTMMCVPSATIMPTWKKAA